MKTVYLAASGDLRLSANQTCEAAQAELEKKFVAACQREGVKVQRAHAYDPAKKHGFIDSQKMGLEVFQQIPEDAPVVVAEAVWQYSHHVLPGLLDRKAPILTVSNFSGEWPGLVGMLNLNGCLAKADKKYSTLWSEDFTDPFFTKGLRKWFDQGAVKHDASHVRPYSAKAAPGTAVKLGASFAKKFMGRKWIMGIFDEGCMGMYNAIIQDELLFPLGLYKERLSQSTLYAKSRTVSDSEAQAVYKWLLDRGHDLPLRQGRGDRAHRAPGARAVQDVRGRAAHRRRVRLRHHRHPVPAGAEGPDARFRSGRRVAQQRGAPAGPCRGERPRALRRQCAAPLQRGRRVRRRGRAHHERPVAPAGATRPRPRCTTCAGASLQGRRGRRLRLGA